MSTTGEAGAYGTPVGIGVNPGYALGRLAKALHTGRTHGDSDTRDRAARKAETWVRVFEGLLSGALAVGSRTPVAGVPPWATPEVAHGGFATGALLAGGPLQPHERELLARLPAALASAERAALNAHYLTDDGLAELRAMLADGRYRVTVPEEAALLVVAWLLDRGEPDAARAVLDAIGAHFPTLRFYPAPDAAPLADSAVVRLQGVGRTARDLAAVRDRPRALAQREAVGVWAPLFDRVVGLFVETVEGPVPTVRRTNDDEAASRRIAVEGGWPCQRYPDGWRERAAAALAEYRRLRAGHTLCRGPDRPRRDFARLRSFLETCVRDPRSLTGRDVGLIRVMVAGAVTKRGVPGSDAHRAYRARQAAAAPGPGRAAFARVLAGRLAGLPPDDGLDAVEAFAQPVTPDEAVRHGVPAGAAIPDTLVAVLRRSLAAPLPELVEAGVVPSAEVLATVVPQVTAGVRAAGIADPALRRLYGALYAAFRRRRSLLLLNLESQVKLHELPWVAAVEPYRRGGLGEPELARQALGQVAVLAVTAFPHQILPNKLLQELRALADAAGVAVPLTDELAADIFMGDFSEKFVRAAHIAAGLLGGTLYERYYGAPFDRVRAIDDVKRSRYGTPTSPAFAALCRELAGVDAGGWSVAANGAVIEWQQILTTHNLAALVETVGLREELRPHLPDLARRCFGWVCRHLRQTESAPWKGRLQGVKNAAYSWRQMVFFVSLLPEGGAGEFLGWAAGHLSEQPAAFWDRFAPALEGLRRAARSLPADDADGSARRFLGWTTSRHWLLA